MLLPVLISNNTSFNNFVSYWSSFYYYDLENLYNNTINNAQFTSKCLFDLFKWKNGMKLSLLKRISLESKIISKLDFINLSKSSGVNLEEFNTVFNNVSAVWRIFLLHIINPHKYPIYDQHIHRAFNFINGLDITNISSTLSDKVKLEFYFETYLKFIESQTDTDINMKRLDEALFTFGQFINTKNYYGIISNKL